MTSLRKLVLIALISMVSLCAHALDRQAFTFTRYNLQVTLDPAKQGFAVTGRVDARNTSDAPQKNLALQISSSLRWTAMRIGDKEVPWVQQPYTSDIDHTGEVSEAILNLPDAIAPGASVTVNFEYEGTITLNTGRLLRVDTPGQYAARTDWDQITDAFTAVRGLGYVVWYPVAMNAALLTDGTAVWERVAEWKQRHRNSVLEATFNVPTGKQLVTNADEGKQSGDTFTVTYQGLARVTPTFTVAPYQVIDRPGMTIYHLPEHTQIARDYVIAAEKVSSQITDFYGTQSHKLILVELPNQDVLPFDDGNSFYFMPMMRLDPNVEQMLMGHQLVHTILWSPRPWINEGLANLAQLLVREQQAGRDAALSYLNQFRETLNEAEKASLQQAPGKGDPLATSNDQVMFRSKSTYVWYMLQDMIGSKALSAAIRAYKPEQDTQPGYMQSLLEANTSPHQSLEQFFDDWVYRDKGLPDFKIVSVYPRATLAANMYIVTVTVENTGEMSSPVTVGVMSDRGERRERGVVSAHGKTIIRVSFPGSPTKAWVNDGSVPETDVTNNTYEITNLPPNPQP